MLFNTLTYLIFLPLVFLFYWTARGAKAKNVVIILSSFVFYGWWDVRFLGLMIATCVANYFTVNAIVGSSSPTQRKRWLTLTLLLNFLVLGVFKYFNFFSQSLAALLGTFGLHADVPTLNVLLPVGISFYTFQLSGFAIDHYRSPQRLGKVDFYDADHLSDVGAERLSRMLREEMLHEEMLRLYY